MEESAQAASAELLWCLGFVWDAAEARRLREKHRLVGDAVGCVAGGALMICLLKSVEESKTCPVSGTWQLVGRVSYVMAAKLRRLPAAGVAVRPTAGAVAPGASSGTATR